MYNLFEFPKWRLLIFEWAITISNIIFNNFYFFKIPKLTSTHILMHAMYKHEKKKL